jgi:hypothetical protein
MATATAPAAMGSDDNGDDDAMTMAATTQRQWQQYFIVDLYV